MEPTNYKNSTKKEKKYLKSMADDSTNVFKTNIQQKYAARPSELNDIWLAEFVAGYNYIR